MDILDSIRQGLSEDAPVREVRRGLNWTAVVSRRCGLASTMAQGGCCQEAAGREGSLTEMSARELIRYGIEGGTVKRSLALAALNSLLDLDPHRHADIEGLELVKKFAKGKNISVIGHFPNLEGLAREAENLWIIEKQPRPGDHPEEKGSDFLPRSDIVVISSTTLINNTLAGILALAREGSVKMLLGPSTPLSPRLFDYGIDLLAGSVVTDPQPVLQSVGEGASFIQLKKKGGIRFVTLVRNHDDILRRLAP